MEYFTFTGEMSPPCLNRAMLQIMHTRHAFPPHHAWIYIHHFHALLRQFCCHGNVAALPLRQWHVTYLALFDLSCTVAVCYNYEGIRKLRHVYVGRILNPAKC